MALLTLTDLGKIYASEGNVAVGIRGVNLSFERGEFVAVTGKSGSGKSTLLNVISGMDTYEEGEMTVDGETTSHFSEAEREEYRSKYVSFIFQDYNIIDSFTVLENVELALMHIEDKEERRRRALELIDRVGLSSHVKHKGSKLSGGQKQRTVIARALAKDSPIILADEPTGNLDSESSREIIKLLKEVSRDKLLILVTHSLDEVENYATRHIRIFDGAVASDTVLRAFTPVSVENITEASHKTSKHSARAKTIRDGIHLGAAIFKAKPRLSAFLCLLMIISTMGIFLMTSLLKLDLPSSKKNMFTHMDGRVVITTESGRALTNDELKSLAASHGAKSYMRYDILLDNLCYFTLPVMDEYGFYDFVMMQATVGEDFGDNIIGRYPTAPNEVFLYLPISYKPTFGKSEVELDTVLLHNTDLTVVGVKYYYDNNLTPKCLFTEDGFKTATATYYLTSSSLIPVVNISEKNNTGIVEQISLTSILTSFELDGDEAYVSSRRYSDLKATEQYSAVLDVSAVYYSYNYYYVDVESSKNLMHHEVSDEHFTSASPGLISETMTYGDYAVVSDELMRSFAEQMLSGSYKQASLFFENDKAAGAAAEELQKEGYIAVPSYTEYTPSSVEAIIGIILALFMAGIWLAVIIFLAFFVTLCTRRALTAFRNDITIMRSMGTPTSVIRIGAYVRMLISLIPAVITVILFAVLIFTTPSVNGMFRYLYPWQYAAMFLGMIILTAMSTRGQMKRLFKTSVKKSLVGGGDQ